MFLLPENTLMRYFAFLFRFRLPRYAVLDFLINNINRFLGKQFQILEGTFIGVLVYYYR